MHMNVVRWLAGWLETCLLEEKHVKTVYSIYTGVTHPAFCCIMPSNSCCLLPSNSPWLDSHIRIWGFSASNLMSWLSTSETHLLLAFLLCVTLLPLLWLSADLHLLWHLLHCPLLCFLNLWFQTSTLQVMLSSINAILSHLLLDLLYLLACLVVISIRRTVLLSLPIWLQHTPVPSAMDLVGNTSCGPLPVKVVGLLDSSNATLLTSKVYLFFWLVQPLNYLSSLPLILIVSLLLILLAHLSICKLQMTAILRCTPKNSLPCVFQARNFKHASSMLMYSAYCCGLILLRQHQLLLDLANGCLVNAAWCSVLSCNSEKSDSPPLQSQPVTEQVNTFFMLPSSLS